MIPDTTYDRHARLVARMHEALGLDPETETLSGDLSPEILARQVERCTGCHKADDCAVWLDTLSGVASEPPVYCRNRDALIAARP